MIPMEFFLTFAAILFAIGLYGIMTTRKGLVSLMCIELMLNAANINFITFAAFNSTTEGFITQSGDVFVIFSIAIAAAEVAIGIAIMLKAYRLNNTNDVDKFATMRW